MLKAISVAAYLAMVLGIVWLVLMRKLLSPAPVVIVVQALAVLLVVWARITFGRRSFHAVASPTEGGLVTDGPYRYIRHPIYTGVSLFAGAAVIAHWSWDAVASGGLILFSSVVRIFCEETLIKVRYPEYRQYSTRTWRMIPFLF
jgi:protein-S-isoprenylcysteine O-methyltransferase Ste14